jgi:hypothetical protein
MIGELRGPQNGGRHGQEERSQHGPQERRGGKLGAVAPRELDHLRGRVARGMAGNGEAAALAADLAAGSVLDQEGGEIILAPGHLRLVAGFAELRLEPRERGLDFPRPLDRQPEELELLFPPAVRERVERLESPRRQQKLQGLAEGPAIGFPGVPDLAKSRERLRIARALLGDRVEDRPDLRRHGRGPGRLVAALRRVGQAVGLRRAPEEHGRAGHLREIVIFGGDPEDSPRAQAAFLEIARHPDRGGRFGQSEKRAGEETRLLSRRHANAVGARRHDLAPSRRRGLGGRRIRKEGARPPAHEREEERRQAGERFEGNHRGIIPQAGRAPRHFRPCPYNGAA